MNKGPSIAVLLPACNGMLWIEEQINSIFAQIGVDIGLYISIDISDDQTYQWCLSLAQTDERVTILSYGERFGGAARNFFRLIREVNFDKYDFVALADQDDIWLPEKLERATIMIRQHDLQAFSSDVIAFFQDGREQLIKKSHSQKRFDYFFESAGPGCTYVFRSPALSQFKQFLIANWLTVNGLIFHDWVLYAYFRHHQLAWQIDNQATMRYRQHEFNQIGPNAGLGAYMKRLGMVQSKWYAKEVEKLFHLIDPTGASGLKLERSFLIRHYRQLRRHPKEALALLFLLLVGLY